MTRCAMLPQFLLVGALLCCTLRSTAASADDKAPAAAIDYNRDVRPILSNNCLKCHGFDAAERKAGLRLDVEAEAKKALESGATAIVPGKAAESELVRRVFADDPDEVMPPSDSNKKLTAAQRDLLRRWIESGAQWKKHWSFEPPQRPEPPAVALSAWPRSPLDRFVLARLEKEGLLPTPEVDKTTLIRRVTLDLTGLPPTPAEVDAFVLDNSPDAYEKVVDRLLASPHFGERMAVEWLDAARYADTHGYHIDSHRDMWKWREWVIDAFTANKPFDQFTVEQLAGDLLPEATLAQRIASGFNRNHMINFEGGAIPEEYLAAYIVDRVSITGTVWMGLTVGCAQCHDHKFDPISQKEFYQFYAFFHNMPENGLDGSKGNAKPLAQAPSPAQEQDLKACRAQIAAAKSRLEERSRQVDTEFATWEKKALDDHDAAPIAAADVLARYRLDENQGDTVADSAGKQPTGVVKGEPVWKPGKAAASLSFDGAGYVDLGENIAFDRGDKFSYGAWVHPTSTEHMAVVARMDDAAKSRGWDLYLGDGKVYVHLVSEWENNAIRVNTKKPIELNKWTHVLATYDGSSKAAGVKIYVNGQPAELQITHDKLSDTIRCDKPLHIGRRHASAGFKGQIDDVRIFGRQLAPNKAAAIAAANDIYDLLAAPADKRTKDQQAKLRTFFLEHQDEPYQKQSAELARLNAREKEIDAAIPTSMVMQELDQPRETFMLVRGQYDKKGEKVVAGVPSSLPPLPAGAAANRLTLARWLVEPGHPLTARVAVNRYWQMYFGAGLVKTAEDFGSQGEWPSHPELLDWLATEFSGGGWNVKAMQRSIVTSATYRQSSVVSKQLWQRDPENRLLARGPRLRLQGEFIRDQALAASGLLNRQIGGPSVYPYQPPGLWEEMAFGREFTSQKYTPSTGADLYRRSMYTFWKRTSPPAALNTFDAPDRETCTVRRSRTNTPLQALVLMNDPTYVEASRKLAERTLRECAGSVEDRIAYGFRLIASRRPSAQESAVLQQALAAQLAVFQKDPQAAAKLLSVGESPRDEKLDPAEFAAWTTLMSVVLNLDETVTKG